MISLVISLGSNCGDRKSQIRDALEWLKNILIQTKCSEIYETPCAKNTGNPYLNAVIAGYYQGTGYEMEDMLKEKERQMGRHAQCRESGDVPIDMDIVIMDGEIIKNWDYRQKFFKIGYSQIKN